MINNFHIFYHHRYLLNSVGLSTFWETFFTEILSGLVLLIIGSFTIPWYLDYRKKPHLVIINPLTRKNIFYFSKASDGFWEATLDFVVKNETNFSQREWFWHILIPSELNPQFESIDKTITCQINKIVINGKKWIHYFGNASQKEVIFPKRGLRFNYLIKIKTSSKESNKYIIHYYFNTEFGTWPPKANELESIAMNQEIDQSIAFSQEYLASISVEPEL